MRNFFDVTVSFQLPPVVYRWLAVCGLQLATIFCTASPLDSLRLETINGKQFIIHQIEAKETLYSISRRYGVKVTDILENNPTADGGLGVGQLLRVPYVPHNKHRTENGITYHKVAAHETLFSIARMYSITVDDLKSWNTIPAGGISVGQELTIKKKTFDIKQQNNTAPPPLGQTQPAQSSVKGVHTVAAKETLYSISRTYGVSISQLKEWNNLTSTELKEGQTLYVVQPMYSTTNTEPVKQQQEVKQQSQQSQPTQVAKQTAEIKISEAIPGTDEVQETGTASLIEGTEGNRKYLAQHKTLKTGSIVKVRNTANNQEVFVRIVNTLDATDSNVIKISRSAYDRIGATDPKVNVMVIYYK